ncbi:hypothetical protein EN802_07650 [bacterium M00.F.Ca.ET.159.01.1.1]|nr:hypothetical protein EN873_09725 [bacterium M00.F.Ca.ET.230.01.1.1]TGT74888.1 hypothetical protein EN802_07650 [bacterium M00.F.Ca.ET.159.01.1.1]TGT87756.1 hypothetical protein EN800_04540 [bacterium M00.F.Ca.ET.157.01.1.1]
MSHLGMWMLPIAGIPLIHIPLHAPHLISGIVVIAGMIGFWRTASPANRLRRVVAIGLYRHFVDIIWVFMFPVLYLINR